MSDPAGAGCMFSRELLQSSSRLKSLCLCMDIRQDSGNQDRDLITFYRREDVRWASPLTCILKGDLATGSGVERHLLSTVIFRLRSGFYLHLGDMAVTKVFEGEPDHLVPSTSELLVRHDMFTVAGRMVGHSFLHGGPSFPGLSPAILHVLFGGSLEDATVTIEDCPDLDIRHAVRMLERNADIEDDDSILHLCTSWNLPAPNAANRRWLSKQILLHAVLGQTVRQIAQFRKGLEETGLWPLFTHRQDVIPNLFPRESEAEVTSHMVLDNIIWPLAITVIFETCGGDEEEDVEDVFRVSTYLKKFIKNASSTELKSLLKFWTGWEVPTKDMKVEVLEATWPSALTCFQKLRLPRHYTTFKRFHSDLLACMSTSDSGFGCY